LLRTFPKRGQAIFILLSNDEAIFLQHSHPLAENELVKEKSSGLRFCKLAITKYREIRRRLLDEEGNCFNAYKK
jgi:hypothetical protein